MDIENIQNVVINLIKNWFTSLNNEDIEYLSNFSVRLVYKINNLFSIKKINSELELKAIILMLLPYIDDTDPLIYSKITDLNELLLSKPLTDNDLNLEMDKVLKKNFKFGNMGISLFNINKKILLKNDRFGKLIYQLINDNYNSLLETLSILNGKLYVNWTNIYPLSLENYKESQIYQNTKRSDFFDEEYNGLYIGEFYNVYRNIYYEGVKKVKWLLFIKSEKYLIQYLNEKFNIDDFINYSSYTDLDNNQKIVFRKTVNSIPENEYDYWENIILFLVNNYSYRNLIVEESYVQPFLNKLEEEEDELVSKNVKIYNPNETKLFLENIDVEHIWDFIKESLTIFETTIYYKLLVKDNKITNFRYYEGTELNLKNIYNIAKALSHNSFDNWYLLPIKYNALVKEQKELFWNKFDNSFNWLNLRKNLNREAGNELSLIDYNLRLNKILNDFQKIKYDLVWYYLATNGLLSEYRDKPIENTKFNDAYYYLTNKKYKDHKIITKDGTLSFFDNLKKSSWYTFYAMNWLSQIRFYNNYLNHRVMFITGATGQGKSTQVPKLFMYGLKMLDYKLNGKVVCTQPRKAPTNTNSRRIAEELGVPILEYSTFFKDYVKTSNYYVQKIHSSDKHNKNYCSHPSLKIVTDGTLFIEILKNPMLKYEIKKQKKYTMENIYDVLIVDEAHEHNTNMDLILTLARQTCYMNNDFKLVIMSATMDDDDPIYRNYYKMINDQLVYPVRADLNYECIHIDRRFHIAAPGQVTKYNINEIYTPGETPENIVTKILNSSKSGDILLFQSGTAEISEQVKKLNESTPPNIIVLPYYAKLNDYYKDIIENLENSLPNIQYDKNKIYSQWSDSYVESFDVPKYTYNRCIIVATNVAEASITIKNLKFVIDNGLSKINKYNYAYRFDNLKEEIISESSRKQRKGRVGRVSSGTVYYLYNKGDTENIKPKYNITLENFENNLIQLLEMKEDINKENENIIDLDNDPNLYRRYQINSRDPKHRNTLSFKKNIIEIFRKQYELNNNPVPNLYWNQLYFHNKENIFSYLMSRKESGYSLDLLLDPFGLFYIIHPFENRIKRNIIGEVIKVMDSDNIFIDSYNNIPTKYFHNLLINLISKYYLLDINLSLASYKNININPNRLLKSELVNYAFKMNESLDIPNKTYDDIITLLTSKAYGSFNEVLEILIMMKTINNSIDNLVKNIKKYDYQDSEIEYIYSVIQDLKKSFPQIKVFKIRNYNDLTKNYNNQYKILIETFLKDHKNKTKTYNYNLELWNSLILAYNNQILSKDQGFMNSARSFISFNYNNYINEINKWAELRNLKPNTILEFLDSYSSNLIDVLTLKKNYDSKLNEKDPLELMTDESYSFKKSLLWKNENEHIIRPFIHGSPYNIAIRYDTNESFHRTIPSNVIVRYSSDFKSNNDNLIFYYNKKLDENGFKISMTNRIELEWLFNAQPYLFRPSNFRSMITIKEGKEYKIDISEGNLFNDLIVKFRNRWTLNNVPFDTSKLPILSIFIKNLKKHAILYEKN
jgi:hypothetical protein